MPLNMVEQIIYRKKNGQKPKFEGVLLELTGLAPDKAQGVGSLMVGRAWTITGSC